MKKILTTLIICLSAIGIGHAQKFALVDMEYIMKAIPAYRNRQRTTDPTFRKMGKKK